MPTLNAHIIKKQVLEVEIASRQGHHALSEEISDLFYRQLKPQLEQLMDRLAPKGSVLNLDRLHLDLGTIAPEHLGEAFSRRFLEEMEKEFKKMAPKIEPASGRDGKTRGEESPTIVLKNEKEQLVEALAFFLEKGRLPWWFEAGSIREFEEQLESLLPQRLPAILRKSPQPSRACRRVAEQFSYSFFKALARAIRPELAEVLPSQPIRPAATAQVLKMILAKKKPEHIPALVKEVKQILQDTARQEGPARHPEAARQEGLARHPEAAEERREAARPAQSRPSEEEIFVHNAGVILLWPFLEPFFSALGLVKEGQFTSPDARERAVLLLEYLATGRREAPEYDLVIPKLLCGHPLEEPVPGAIGLAAREEQESMGLLTSVLEHWGALGTSGPDGLREGFLQRDGRLSRTGDDWRLVVDPRGYDLLLGSLPWGIGLVRLGWMEGMVIVEWG